MSFVISHPEVEGTAVIPERTLPLYAAKGWVLRGRTDHDVPTVVRPALAQPHKSDSSAEWKTYAVATGMDYDTAMSKTRDELAEHFSPTPKPAPAEKQRTRRNTPSAPDPDPVVDTAAPAPAADTTQES